MSRGLIAKASVVIDAPVAKVWEAFVNPEVIKQYMFGTEVVSEWKPGSSIAWRGEWQGKRYEDKGVILRLEPGRLIEYSHYSPLSGMPDSQEHYHTVTVELTGDGAKTSVSLSQDNNDTEETREHSARNWTMMLDGLKRLLEQ